MTTNETMTTYKNFKNFDSHYEAAIKAVTEYGTKFKPNRCDIIAFLSGYDPRITAEEALFIVNKMMVADLIEI